MPEPPVRLMLAVNQERDVTAWSRDHAAGFRPSRLPYGLDGLGGPGRDLVVVPAPQPRPGRRRVRQLARLLPAGGSGRRVLVAWDEHTASRVAPPRRGVEMHAGVIWLTDRDPSRADVQRRARELRRLDGLWCLSRAQLGPLADLLGAGGPPVSHVTFGVDHRFFTPAPPVQGRPLVVSVGGDRDRDAATLFAALEKVLAAVPEVDVLVQTKSGLTPPPGVRTVERLRHAELRDLYRRMSVMVIATRPNLHVSGMTVALESAATARPVVVTSSPGLDDYVGDGVTGRVVGRDPGDLADAVVDLVRDPDLAARLGTAARQRVEARHTTNHLCADLARALRLPGDDAAADVVPGS